MSGICHCLHDSTFHFPNRIIDYIVKSSYFWLGKCPYDEDEVCPKLKLVIRPVVPVKYCRHPESYGRALDQHSICVTLTSQDLVTVVLVPNEKSNVAVDPESGPISM